MISRLCNPPNVTNEKYHNCSYYRNLKSVYTSFSSNVEGLLTVLDYMKLLHVFAIVLYLAK